MRARRAAVSDLLRSPFAREFSWLSASSQTSAVLSLLTLLILVRSAPVPEVGQVVFAQAAAALVFLVLDPRFEDAVQRFFPLIAIRSRDNAVSFYWRLARWDAALGLTVATIALLTWAVGALPESNVAKPAYLALAFASTGVACVVGTLHAAFAVTQRLTSLARMTLVLMVCNAILMAGGALLLGGSGYLLGNLGGSCLQVGVLLVRCKRLLPRPAGGSCPELPSGLGRFLANTWTSSSLAVGYESGVLVLAGVGGGPSLVALLRVAQSPGRLLLTVFSPLATQAFPRLSLMAARGQRQALLRLTMRSTRLVLGASALVVPLGALVMQPAIELLYGEDYAAASLAAGLLLAAGALRAAAIWGKVLPLAVGRPTLRLLAVLGESVLMLAGTAVITHIWTAATTAATAIAALSLIVSCMLLGFWVAVSRWRDLLRAHP